MILKNVSVSLTTIFLNIMKKFLSLKTVLIPLLFLGATLVRADLVLVQQVTSNGKTNQMTVKIKGDKIRTDLPEMGVIINVANGDMITLMKAQKMVMKLSGETTKAMASQMAKMHPNQTAMSKPKATGKMEKVGKYNAEIYTSKNGNLKMKYWVVKDFPDYATIQKAMDKLQSGPLAVMLKGKMPDVKDFPGMVVKSEVTVHGAKGDHTVTTTLVSAKEEPVSDSEFEVPADYKSMAMPGSKSAPHTPNTPPPTTPAAPAPAK